MMGAARLFFRNLRVLCRKELIATLRDPRLKALLLLAPLLQGFLFGYAANYNLDRVPYAAVDLSGSAASRDFLARLDGAGTFLRVASPANVSEIAPLIDAEDILLAVVIPPDFERQLARGGVADVQVLADGRNSAIAGLATGYAATIAAAWNEVRGARPAVTVETRTWYNPNQTTRWNFLAGLIAMISFVQVVSIAGLSIAKEREEGTFDQLLVTPLSWVEILIGKAMAPILIGLWQSMVLFFIAFFWFGVPFAGNIFSILLTIFVFALSSTGIGLSISSISRNMQQVLVYCFVILMPMVMLSGIATPVHNMPDALQALTFLDPMRFAVDAIRRIYLEGAGLFDVAQDLFAMLAIATATLPLAGWLFRHKTV